MVSWQAFRGKWDKEVDHSYPLDDLEGIVDASILKKAPPKAQHPYEYGSIVFRNTPL